MNGRGAYSCPAVDMLEEVDLVTVVLDRDSLLGQEAIVSFPENETATGKNRSYTMIARTVPHR